MAFHDDLLACAQAMIPVHLPPYPPPAPPATLRRGVSTAYYALFHLLVSETMERVIADPLLRTDMGRLIDHNPTRKVCKEYAEAERIGGALQLRNGDVIPDQLQSIAHAFGVLIEARHRADYDPAVGKDFTPNEAYTLLMTVEAAFLDWIVGQSDPATGKFLGKLFQASLSKRPL